MPDGHRNFITATPTVRSSSERVGRTHDLGERHVETQSFVPTGDNDWTDCDRTTNGGFNPLERLDHERALFFATDRTFGKKALQQGF